MLWKWKKHWERRNWKHTEDSFALLRTNARRKRKRKGRWNWRRWRDQTKIDRIHLCWRKEGAYCGVCAYCSSLSFPLFPISVTMCCSNTYYTYTKHPPNAFAFYERWWRERDGWWTRSSATIYDKLRGDIWWAKEGKEKRTHAGGGGKREKRGRVKWRERKGW